MRGLYAAKPWYTARLSGAVRRAEASRTSPDVFTAAGVCCAALAAVTIWQGWWLATAVLLAGRLAGANLDGAVARARGVARPWGFIVNELGDRASDLAMFAGLCLLAARVGHRPFDVPLVLIAALAATLPTFASLAAAGAGVARANGGPLGKTERCALVVVAIAWPPSMPAVCVVVIVGSVATAALRLGQARRALTSAAGDTAATR